MKRAKFIAFIYVRPKFGVLPSMMHRSARLWNLVPQWIGVDMCVCVCVCVCVYRYYMNIFAMVINEPRLSPTPPPMPGRADPPGKSLAPPLA